MKQMPVESRFAYVGMRSRAAIARTSRFVISPNGNSTGASCDWVSRCRKYVWSFDASTALTSSVRPEAADRRTRA